MNCVYCRSQKTFVVESRVVNGCVERSRQCVLCNKRFRTKEEVTSKSDRVFASRMEIMKKPRHYYTVYDTKTDEVLAHGNARECARQLNIAENTFYRAVMDANRGLSNKYDILTDDFEEGEIE